MTIKCLFRETFKTFMAQGLIRPILSFLGTDLTIYSSRVLLNRPNRVKQKWNWNNFLLFIMVKPFLISNKVDVSWISYISWLCVLLQLQHILVESSSFLSFDVVLLSNCQISVLRLNIPFSHYKWPTKAFMISICTLHYATSFLHCFCFSACCLQMSLQVFIFLVAIS